MSEQDLEVYRRSRLPPSAFRLPGMEDMKVQRQQVRSTLDMGRLKLQQPSCSKDADGVQLRNSSPENGKFKNDQSQVFQFNSPKNPFNNTFCFYCFTGQIP